MAQGGGLKINVEDTPALIRLTAGANASKFRLSVTDGLCVGSADRRFLFGGAGLGAAIAAMQQAAGRSLVYASAQFLSFARPGETLDLDVTVLNAGRNTSQAMVVGTAADRNVLRVAGALGTRSSEFHGRWTAAPAVPPPNDCTAAQNWRGSQGLHAGLDVRVASGRYGMDRVGAPEPSGRLVMWVRPRHSVPVDAAFLAIVADMLPSGVGNALGRNAGGHSLDNVLRILEVRPTSWVLADIMIAGMESGVAHGTVKLFADDGGLMAIGSQSLVIRAHDSRQPGAMDRRGSAG